jgi:diguanylate cyclase (GGDEF)-like protein
VTTELTFLIVSGVVGALLLLGAGLAWLSVRAERASAGAGEGSTGEARREQVDKYDAGALRSQEDIGRTTSGSVIRVLWWVTIAGVLVGTGLAGAYAANQSAIYALGGVAAIAVIVLHEAAPRAWRSTATAVIEIAVALALVTGLLLLTGYAASPYVLVLGLVVVAVALARGGWPALATVAVATAAYAFVAWADPNLDVTDGPAMLRIGLNVGAIWLLAALAGAFSSQAERMRQHLIALWRIDPLTGLFTRGQLYGDLEQEVLRTRRNQRSFSILMVDLDGLKQVNDSLGHQRGDEVLRSLGRVMRERIRQVDSAYRYGGDEFIVLLPETDYAGAFVVAENIRAAAEEAGRRLEAEGAATSVSIGLVSYPEDATTAEELVRASDRAMYNAKALGKNQISGLPRTMPTAGAPATGRSVLFRRQEPREPEPDPGGGESGPGGPPASGGGQPRRWTSPEPGAPGAAGAQPPVVSASGPELASAPWPAPTLAPSGRAIPSVADEAGDEEPDVEVMRRHFAVARRAFDPDHHIDAAMDVFLTPRVPRPPSGQEPPLPS